MKPDFALSLSFEGISLLTRSAAGWLRVGEAALDTSDLAPELAELRQKAEDLVGGAIRTKLIIPGEQIKFLSIPAPDERADGRTGDRTEHRTEHRTEAEALVRAALEGATPYAVEDLVYDWREAGGMLRIAAVARETLDEAESFAESHGFHPVGFVAQPQDGFPGEVSFGPVAGAAFTPDEKPMRVIGVVVPPEEADALTSGSGDAAETEPRQLTQDEAVAPENDAVEVSAAEPGMPGMEDAATAEPVEEPPLFASKRPAAEPTSAAEDDPDPVAAADPGPVPGPDTEPPLRLNGAAPEAAEPDTAAPEDAEPEDAAPDSAERGPVDPPPAPPAPETPAVTFTAHPRTAPGEEPASPLDKMREAASALPFFGSRRKEPRDVPPRREDITPPAPTAAPPPAPPLSRDAPRKDPAPGFSSFRAARQADAEKARAPSLAGAHRGNGRVTAPKMPVPGRAPAPMRDDAPRLDVTPEPTAGQLLDTGTMDGTMDGTADAPARATAPQPDSAPQRPGWRGRRKDSAEIDPQAAERERMTVFGARRKAEIGGKPRFLGLMLTAALLVFLAGVAAWASIFVEDGLSRFFAREADEPVIALTPEALDAATLDDAELADAISEPDVGEEAPVVVAALDDPDMPSVTDDTVPSALRQPRLPDSGQVLSDDEAQALYSETGVWQRAPEAPGAVEPITLDNVYVASIDGAVDSHDAVALPAPRGADTDFALLPQRLPPPPGARFRIDDRGFFIPTPEGVETPQGYTLIAGPPPLLPRLRPGTLTGDGATGGPEGVNPAALPAPEARPETLDAPAAENPLAGSRPRPRPTDLVEQVERGQLGGRSKAELAGIRPKLRPQAAQERAAAAATLEEAAIAEAVAEADSVPVGTAQAVAASRLPKPRPGNFARQVQRAQRVAPQRETQVAAVAPRSVSPKIPTKATVARQATVKNAINLRRINLIGVYGKPSSRRALVRLASGRYKKVKVGDRIDGGRVAAIGDNALRYTKGGRSITLQMPKS